MGELMKKIYTLSYVIAGALLLNACSSTPIYKSISQDAEIVVANKNTPSLVQDVSVNIGQVVLMKESGTYSENKIQTVTLLNKLTYEYLEHPGIGKGKTTALGITDSGGYAACFNDAQYNDRHIRFCLFDENKDGAFEEGSFEGTSIDGLKTPYKIISESQHTATTDYVKQTLTYKGLLNGKIVFDYSQYAGNMAKATFTQPFSIKNQKDVRIIFNFKGAEIIVKKATSTNITYEVIKHFN
jgi:hypothetical protein